MLPRENSNDLSLSLEFELRGVRSKLEGSAMFAFASPTIRCGCAVRSFEIAEFLLLLWAENFVNLGLHAGVRDD